MENGSSLLNSYARRSQKAAFQNRILGCNKKLKHIHFLKLFDNKIFRNIRQGETDPSPKSGSR